MALEGRRVQGRQGVTRPFLSYRHQILHGSSYGLSQWRQKNGRHWAPAISTKAQQEQKTNKKAFSRQLLVLRTCCKLTKMTLILLYIKLMTDQDIGTGLIDDY